MQSVYNNKNNTSPKCETRAMISEPGVRNNISGCHVICTFEAGEDVGEDLSFDDHLSQLDRVLADLGQCGEHLTLQLCVGVEGQVSEVSDRARIHNSLCQLCKKETR